MAVGVQTQPGVTFGPPAAVSGGLQPGFTSAESRGYDVLPDGRFITLLPPDNAWNGGVASEMRIVLNWFEELKRLVPTK